ncbi:MAG: Vacuolar protease A [Bogoriella megaspora]|nr:MAG: Vacuolar protease A [Bogoriella megaspora]
MINNLRESLIIALATVAGARTIIRSPISQRLAPKSRVQPSSLLGRDEAQEPLLTPGTDTASKSPINATNLLNYIEFTIDITVGTPPQPFTVAIDIDSGDIPFVPSNECKGFCWQKHNFTSEDSSTYVSTGPNYYSEKSFAVNYDGPVGKDTVRINNVEIMSQTFMQWTSGTCYSILCLEGLFDGVFGFAPPWNHRNHPDNLLSTILSQELLRDPVVSLRLPRNVGDTGEFVLGGSEPPDSLPEPITLPLVNATDDVGSPFADLWSVRLTNMTFNTPKPLFQNMDDNAVAILSTAQPWIILPTEFARNLTEALGAEHNPRSLIPYILPCERRQELPTLTIGLGDHRVEIDAWDYTMEWVPYWPPDSAPLCIPTFQSTSAFGYPNEYAGIVLGSPFLKRFYSSFDPGKREVRLTRLEV